MTKEEMTHLIIIVGFGLAILIFYVIVWWSCIKGRHKWEFRNGFHGTFYQCIMCNKRR